jgi:hypothetical protein
MRPVLQTDSEARAIRTGFDFRCLAAFIKYVEAEPLKVQLARMILFRTRKKGCSEEQPLLTTDH